MDESETEEADINLVGNEVFMVKRSFIGPRGQINFREHMHRRMQITGKLHGQQESNFLPVYMYVDQRATRSRKLSRKTSR